jgi:hypothetical protein
MKKRILITVAVVLCLSASVFILVKAQVLHIPFFEKEVEQELVEEFPMIDTITGKLTNDIPLTELRKIAEAYNRQPVFRFSSKIYALKNEDAKPVEQTTMLFERNGKEQYYRVGAVEYIVADSTVLLVNNDIKAMSLTTNTTVGPQDQLSQLRHIEEYLQMDSVEAFVSTSGDSKFITINNPGHPHVQQYIIKYSPVSLYVEEIRIYMAIVQEEERTEEDIQKAEMQNESEKAKRDTATSFSLSDLGLEQAVYRVVIRYSDYTSSFEFSDEHRIRHFILIADGEYIPAKGFEEYDLNN